MMEEIMEKYQKFYDGLEEILKETFQVLEHGIELNEKWRLKIIDAKDRQKLEKELKENAMKELSILKTKVMRNEKICIVFGDTSAGKTTLINAILKTTDLPSGFGSTTQRLVQIRQNTKEQTFHLFQDSEDSKLGEAQSIWERNDSEEGKSLSVIQTDITDRMMNNQNRGHIDLYLKKSGCSFLNENMIIIDTPGVDTNINMDSDIIKFCEKADLFILVINSSVWINNNIFTFIKRFTTSFSKLNLLLVFNHWDEPDSEDTRDETKSYFIGEAKKLFENKFPHAISVTEENIFFLCAIEQLWIVTDAEKLENISRWENRNEEFRRFEEYLKKLMFESPVERRKPYVQLSNNVMKNFFDSCQSEIRKIKDEQSKSIQPSIINKLNGLQSEIEGIVKSVFTEASDYLNKNISQKNLLESLRDIARYYTTKLKNQIKDHINQKKDEYLTNTMRIYLSYYYDTENVNEEKLDDKGYLVTEINQPLNNSFHKQSQSTFGILWQWYNSKRSGEKQSIREEYYDLLNETLREKFDIFVSFVEDVKLFLSLPDQLEEIRLKMEKIEKNKIE